MVSPPSESAGRSVGHRLPSHSPGLIALPAQCTKVADNRKRELPRIPFAPKSVTRPESSKGLAGKVTRTRTPFDDSGRATQSGFWPFATAKNDLARLPREYEQLNAYLLRSGCGRWILLRSYVAEPERLEWLSLINCLTARAVSIRVHRSTTVDTSETRLANLLTSKGRAAYASDSLVLTAFEPPSAIPIQSAPPRP